MFEERAGHEADEDAWRPVAAAEAALMENPYTIHQALTFMEAAPAMKIFSLVDGVVTIDETAARSFTERERVYPSEFDIDELSLWNRPLSVDEIHGAYAALFEPIRASRMTWNRSGTTCRKSWVATPGSRP